jgi:flagellar hook-associated protein 2
MDMQGIFTKMLNNGASYEDLKEIGITYAEDWGDGGTLVFDEAKFKTAMENDPEKVSNIFAGGGNVKKGLIDTIDEALIPYATRYGSKNDNGNGKGSYGRLIDIAGSEKKPTTLMENEIYKELQRMQETIDSLNERLKMEQDRYISQFTTMESLLNKMNTQSSYLSQLTA